MKTKIITWSLIIIGIFGLLWWGGKNQASLPAKGVERKSELTAEEIFYDFGTISMAKGNVSKTFKVTNPTEKDITIRSITTSCMCTNAYVVELDGKKEGPFGMPGHGAVPKVNKIIKTNESLDIEVVYDPNAHGPAGIGRIDRFVYLEDSEGGALNFEVKANVTP